MQSYVALDPMEPGASFWCLSQARILARDAKARHLGAAVSGQLFSQKRMTEHSLFYVDF